jgi:type I site-specific restriction-modification system R (restriction) subunit
VLSDRRNIVVIADEAHRSQYDFIDGFARHIRDALPQASFARTNTRAVFGDYISIYDIARAVEDGATVPIYYEGRLAFADCHQGHVRLGRALRDLRDGDPDITLGDAEHILDNEETDDPMVLWAAESAADYRLEAVNDVLHRAGRHIADVQPQTAELE